MSGTQNAACRHSLTRVASEHGMALALINLRP
jgi:hypothetical protein